MPQGCLLGRLLLRFGKGEAAESIIGELSAAAFDAAGGLWLASDELDAGRVTLSRLQADGHGIYGRRQRFELRDYLDLPAGGDEESEADIEGLDIFRRCLWLTGSHSSKRSRPKGRNREKDLARLARVTVEANRFLLGRIPLVDGAPARSAAHPDRPGEQLDRRRASPTAKGGTCSPKRCSATRASRPVPAHRAQRDGSSTLLPLAAGERLRHRGARDVGRAAVPGLRGPVLRGWATLWSIEPRDEAPGRLGLAGIGDRGHRYRSISWSRRLGIRELARDGDDL